MSKSNLPLDPSNIERGLQLLDEEFDEGTELDALLTDLRQESPQIQNLKIGRLPVYLVVDTSASMSVQDKIALVNQQMRAMTEELKKNARIKENAYISVIAFNDTARQIVPLTSLKAFIPPTLQAEGNTSLGEALSLTAQKIATEVKVTPVAGKTPDLEPTVFLMSDGYPTDENYMAGVIRLKDTKPTPRVIAIAFGHDANIEVLKSITSDVFKMESLQQGDFAKLFKWFADIVAIRATAPALALNSARAGQKQMAGKQILALPPVPSNMLPV